MFEKVKHAGLSCWADSMRKENYGSLVLLSIFGDRNAVRAVWATLCGNGRRHHSVEVGDFYVSRKSEGTYNMIQAPIGTGLLHMILVDSMATLDTNFFADEFFQLGPNASQRFYNRLSRFCAVPLRAEWRDEIWQLGIEHDLIKPMAGFGMTAHRVTAKSEKWAPVIKAGVLSGRLR